MILDEAERDSGSESKFPKITNFYLYQFVPAFFFLDGLLAFAGGGFHSETSGTSEKHFAKTEVILCAGQRAGLLQLWAQCNCFLSKLVASKDASAWFGSFSL